MSKEKYKEVLETQYNDVIVNILGWHELVNVLQALSDYINICIAMKTLHITFLQSIIEKKTSKLILVFPN